VKRYSLSGRVSLGVVASDEAASAVARHIAPFDAEPTGTDSAADVVLEFGGAPPARFVDVQNPARDGLTTAYDGQNHALLIGDRACVFVPSDDGLTVRCSSGFPLGPLFRTVVRPALQTAAVRHDAVAVHSAAVEVDGQAVLIAGWSESGKTETALALMEVGAGWLSDKWTFLGSDGEASAFPITVGVRRWVLPYLPGLAAALPWAARVQVAAAGAVATATQPLRRLAPRGGGVGAAAAVAARIIGLADRAALTQEQIRTIYGQADDPTRRVPLGTLALLTTVPHEEVTVEVGRAAWAAERLAVTGAYERHDWYMIRDRWAYARPGLAQDDRIRAMAYERQILERALSGARVLNVQAPFPVDPRRVADAIREAM
jgi:hypothetical protein